MMGQNKARCTIQFVDAAGKPIKGLNYWLKDERDYQIAKGETNSAGMSYELVQDVGAEVNVFVEKYRQNEWKKLKTFYLHDRFQIVRLESPKILLESTTVQHEGNTGEYQRKTHEVKKSETLSGIAQKYGTTVRALERLNQIENAGRLAIGQVLKLPIKTPAGTAGGGAVASQTQQPSSTTPRSTSSGDRSHNQTPSGSVMDRLGKMGDEVAQDVASGWNRLSQWGEEVSQEAKTGWERLSGATTSSTGVLDKAEQWYNARKAELEKAAKELFTIKIDRSANTTSPKDDVRSNCRTQPACIPKGTKSELIREVNIRLAGFGGALPTDEFTDLTEKCIKQFQRDYMGVPETGKICGSLLVALDEFMAKYPMDKFFTQMKCKCGKCSGYGQGQMNVNWFGKRANEYPGIYRGLVWILRASQFYLDKAKLGYDILKISSGYRCIEDNKQHKDSQGNWPRKTINHMGLALDVQYVKKGETTRTGQAGIDTIRSKIFTEFIGAAFSRGTDKIYLESSAEGAKTWVHFDCTGFSIKSIGLFVQNIEAANGRSLVSIAKNQNLNQLIVCGGTVSTTTPQMIGESLSLTEQDVIDLIKVTSTEVVLFKSEIAFQQQTAGVVDTILNRVKSGHWGNTVRDVVNAHRQFSKITGPKNLDPYGSVQNMPLKDVHERTKQYVKKYLKERSNGRKSIVGNNLNYANKYVSDDYNRTAWVNAFHEEAVKSNLIFGSGKAVHAHGTTVDLMRYRPKEFYVLLPTNFDGI